MSMLAVFLCLLSGVAQPLPDTAAGVTQTTWSRIENGSSALTIEQLGLAARRLGKQPGDIVRLADEASQQLETQGMRVDPHRETGGMDSGIAFIGLLLLEL